MPETKNIEITKISPVIGVTANLFNIHVEEYGPKVDIIEYTGLPGRDGELIQTFESISKNIKGYPADMSYNGDDLETITYDLGNGLFIVKTLNYSSGDLTSIVLSGDIPTGLLTTKTIIYDNFGNVESLSYS